MDDGRKAYDETVVAVLGGRQVVVGREQWAPVEGVSPDLREVALVSVRPARAGGWGRLIRSRERSLVVAGFVTLALIALATAIWPPGTGSPLAYLDAGSVRREVPRSTPDPSPSASASATPSPSAAQRYRAAVASGGQEVTDRIDAATTACAPPADLASCRAALQSLREQVAAYRVQLGAARAPACMAVPDGQMRQALGVLDDGASRAVDGIDQVAPDEIVAGSGLIQQAGQQMGAARRQVDAAPC